MSSEAMNFVAELGLQPIQVNGVKVPVTNQRSVLLSLAWHHNYKTNLCFPSIETLKNESGMGSNNTTSRAIAALLKQGVIRQKRGNRRFPTQYFFNFDHSPGGATVDPSDATVAPLSDTVNASHATVAPLSDATVNASHATVNDESCNGCTTE